MKRNLLFGIFAFPLFLNAQVGVDTSTPQKTLHVNGSLQITNELNVGGNGATAGNAGLAGQVLKSNGPGLPPTWENMAGLPTSTGTVIIVDGELMVAQELMLQMSADFSGTGAAGATTPNVLGNLTNEIIDNENRYTGTSTSNSFTVSQDGVYQILMNVQISTVNVSVPVVGVWDNTAGKWVARVNDVYTAPTGGLQTYSLITSVPMLASNTYSFRASNTENFIIKHLSSGTTGSGPVTQVSIKRLK
ncbi:hypothetical protein [Chryseobacterium oryctis]|uniref:C1q domain-containing protein n=1 Tax=Chryseobacterium oryctis TaxID=2952618 RepID=A0ABT3HP64_9FLAO|nr:hypothetical protein [Chryseobacterium oryctis]MCW3161582.1 hypothetical protein [Chryseobacterium oryctis]